MLSVMVVDDSLILRKKLTEVLIELGHRVVASASSGAEARALYGKHVPDLVTMDISMPEEDGVEATKRLLEKYPAALVIMVTSHGNEAMVVTALEAGARGYVLKPVKKTTLQKMIDFAISTV